MSSELLLERFKFPTGIFELPNGYEMVLVKRNLLGLTS